MKRYGLREANQHFARMLRIVRGGEEVLLLDRGKAVAIVKPVNEPRAAVDRLAARGLVLRARKPGFLSPFRPVQLKGGLSQAVIEDREEHQ